MQECAERCNTVVIIWSNLVAWSKDGQKEQGGEGRRTGRPLTAAALGGQMGPPLYQRLDLSSELPPEELFYGAIIKLEYPFTSYF